MGLQGKVNLTSVMTEEEIKSEIRSAFMEAMGNDVSFPFTFLQTSGCGAKTLAAPSLSTSFHWNAQEVSKLGKACFYILAGKKLIVEDVKVYRFCFNFTFIPKFCVYRRSMWIWLGTLMMMISFSRNFQKGGEFLPVKTPH